MNKYILLLFSIFISLSALANGVEINGICYILDTTAHTASVTYKCSKDFIKTDNSYTGEVYIPRQLVLANQVFNVTSIGDSAFLNCTSLTEVYVPNSVTKVGYISFGYCSGLKHLTLPNSVTYVGAYIFTGDMTSTIVSCMALTPPTVQYSDLGAALTILVPQGSIDAYQAALGWKRHPIKPILTEIHQNSANSVDLTWYPVNSASLYSLHIYSDPSSQITLDTTLCISANAENGGVIQKNASSSYRVKQVVLDDIGTVVVISIDPTSGASLHTPFIVNVSYASKEEIRFHFNLSAYDDSSVIKEDQGTFVLNDILIDETFSFTMLPIIASGIYDLQGKRIDPSAWPTLPAGVYVVSDGEKTTKLMKN